MGGTGRNITLIGMPGSGKSTLGRMLASRLGYRFVDGDDLIRDSGRELQAILDEEGEDAFLRLENRVLAHLTGKGMVIAPGGSCVLSREAMEHLRRISLVVYMDVPLEVLRTRLKDAPMRGIVGLDRHSLEELHALRRPLYESFAHTTLVLSEEDSNPEAALVILLDRIAESIR